MKRFFFGIVAILVAATALVYQPAAAASKNNFTITSYVIQYDLTHDEEGRSVLKTVETITADFPQSDENHGLERAIPSSYDGHSTSLDMVSVTNEQGEPWNYSTRTEYDMTIFRIGDADTYVHGPQVYRLEYTQRDVTRYYQDTGRNEWYWDTNGTGWQVPINVLDVSITIDDSLTPTLQGEPFCYQGYSGSNDPCLFTTTDETPYHVTAVGLAAGENVTVAFGFTPGTFIGYQPSLWDRLVMAWWIIQIAIVFLAAILGFVLKAQYDRRHNRIVRGQPIAVEYIPPSDASVTVASQVVTTNGSVYTAQLLDLAVRRLIAIVETRAKSTWHQAEYDILITGDLRPVRSEEKEIIRDMFGTTPKVGERIALKSLRFNTVYGTRLQDNATKLQKLLLDTYKLRQKSSEASRYFYRWSAALLAVSILILSIPLIAAAVTAWVFGYMITPLTDEGVKLRLYLLGLKKYISSSEIDRLNFLQGPDTAEKVGYKVDVNAPGELVKLYERTLPYAVLFGKEKEWAKRLGDMYEQTQGSPDWYQGDAVFRAAYFASAIHSFTSVANTSYVSGSSSTGGSSGGGSSGGGGGGGGGGGW